MTAETSEQFEMLTFLEGSPRELASVARAEPIWPRPDDEADVAAIVAALERNSPAEAVNLERAYRARTTSALGKLWCARLDRRLGGEIADEILGIAFEVSVPSGKDTLALYADSSARYENFSGSRIFWNDPADANLAALLRPFAQGAQILARTPGWTTRVAAPLAAGGIRITLVGTRETRSQSIGASRGAPALEEAAAWATATMQALVARTRRPSPMVTR